MLFSWLKKNKVEQGCPLCGAKERCMTESEYQGHITITGAGVVAIDSKYLFQTCEGKKQLKALEKIHNKRIRKEDEH